MPNAEQNLFANSKKLSWGLFTPKRNRRVKDSYQEFQLRQTKRAQHVHVVVGY